MLHEAASVSAVAIGVRGYGVSPHHVNLLNDVANDDDASCVHEHKSTLSFA